jgi:hypothetical protein
MAARAKTIKVGTVIPLSVTQRNIDESIPCDKGKCMLTLSGIETLEARFGKQRYNVKSTNHGMTFDINGYRILCVFDHNSGHRIYTYDEIFRKTRNMAKARASVKPFKAKLMVESCQKVPTFPPMSDATKKLLAARAKERGYTPKATGIRTTNRRQLSE